MYPTTPGSQKGAAPTSAQAAPVQSEAQTLRDTCLRILKKEALTADEVADRMCKSILAIRPRITELNKQHLIEDSGQRRVNASGKNAVVWRAIANPLVQRSMF